MRQRDLEMLAVGAILNQPSSPRTEYVTRTVHEHRAPTDDSIRLAREYEEKAWAAVGNRVLHDIPSINAKVVAAEDDCATGQKYVLFTVNGRRVHLRYDKLRSLTHQEMIEDVAQEVAREVVCLMLAGKTQL